LIGGRPLWFEANFRDHPMMVIEKNADLHLLFNSKNQEKSELMDAGDR
jgi:hypothetical protein